MTEGTGTPRRILAVLPLEMSSRNVIHSTVAGLLAQQPGIDIVMATRDPGDAERLKTLSGRPIRWEPLYRPVRMLPAGWWRSVRGWRWALGDLLQILGFLLHLSLTYRFNTLQGFIGFRNRLQQSWPLRRAALREGHPASRWLGLPCAGSRQLFDWLYCLYASGWQRHPEVERQFDAVRPDALVLFHLQTTLVTSYARAAERRGIPILGVNGSWDQPTTKGPLVTMPDRMLVQSAQVRDELIRHHGADPARIEIVGWPQMDVYFDAAAEMPREQVLALLGLPADWRYMLVGAYGDRLGHHEPAMCAALAERLRAGEFGQRRSLVIRVHPLDINWKQRFAALHAPPHVIVTPPELGNLAQLGSILRMADAVIASAGTINLDAVAVDAPSVAIAFEDEDQPFHDRTARRYDMEHFAAVIKTGGIRLVHDQAELEAALRDYIADRARDAAARARLRALHLAPVDGGASRRIAIAIARFALEHGRT